MRYLAVRRSCRPRVTPTKSLYTGDGDECRRGACTCRVSDDLGPAPFETAAYNARVRLLWFAMASRCSGCEPKRPIRISNYGVSSMASSGISYFSVAWGLPKLGASEPQVVLCTSQLVQRIVPRVHTQHEESCVHSTHILR